LKMFGIAPGWLRFYQSDYNLNRPLGFGNRGLLSPSDQNAAQKLSKYL
jgi:hypothetical protein